MTKWSENFELDVKAAARIFKQIDHWPTEEDIRRIAEELAETKTSGRYIATAGLVVVKDRWGASLFIDPHIAGLYLDPDHPNPRKKLKPVWPV